MRLAVFTNQFPTRVGTFFARDMTALHEAGVEVDVFPIYDCDPNLWQYVPEIPCKTGVFRDRVHHLRFGHSLMLCRPWPLGRFAGFLRRATAIGCSALPFGLLPTAKSVYTLPKAWCWAREWSGVYDHVLAYWGNYSATCARVFHGLLDAPIPFSMFLHAGTDLYRTQVYLRQKLLYADNVFVVCEFNREFIRQKYPRTFPRIAEKIHVHHLGLNMEDLPFRRDGRHANRILGVGRLEWRKGYDYLLQATCELLKRGVHVEVELIGEGEAKESLATLAEKLGIADRVIFSGWLPFEKVQDAVGAATLLVHPSPVIGDAVPTVIKEAQALGTPVIASHVAGIPELLDHGRSGMLVPPKDVGAISDAIENLLSDGELRQRYALAAREYAEKTYNMWRNGARLANLMRDTVRQR